MQVQFGGIYTFYKKPDTEVAIKYDSYYRKFSYGTEGGDVSTKIEVNLSDKSYQCPYIVLKDRVLLTTPKLVDENDSVLYTTLLTMAERIKDDELSKRSVVQALQEQAEASPSSPPWPTEFNGDEFGQGGQY
jgi:hypothetical protein